MKIKVFDYIAELDCFIVRKEFTSLMERLYLTEWTPVVWLGRLFTMDNDFGEHWFDNWDERSELATRAKELGIDQNELMIVVPERFTDHGSYCVQCRKRVAVAFCPDCKNEIHVGPDGPCTSDGVKKRFWTDVLNSLNLDLDTIFTQAREYNIRYNNTAPIYSIIEEIKNEFSRNKASEDS